MSLAVAWRVVGAALPLVLCLYAAVAHAQGPSIEERVATLEERTLGIARNEHAVIGVRSEISELNKTVWYLIGALGLNFTATVGVTVDRMRNRNASRKY